jgi:hypothetical protein
MKKGALPVPYIVAIIIAIIVIAVLVYWFFVLSGKGTGTATEQFCRTKEFTYCSAWAPNNYDPTKKPNGVDFCCGTGTYAPECESCCSNWASAVDITECQNILP